MFISYKLFAYTIQSVIYRSYQIDKWKSKQLGNWSKIEKTKTFSTNYFQSSLSPLI